MNTPAQQQSAKKQAYAAVLLTAIASFICNIALPSAWNDCASTHTPVKSKCSTSVNIDMQCALKKSLYADRENLLDFRGPFSNFFYSSRLNTIFCTPPKVASTTFRMILRDIEDFWDGRQIRNSSGDVHSDWFVHQPGILGKLSNDRRIQLLTNSSIKRKALIRDPEDRFLSAVLNRGHKVLGRQRYNKIGCAGANTANGSPCWKAGYNSTLELQDAVLKTLLRKNNNDHFRQQTDICGFGKIPYDKIYQVYELSTFLDDLCDEEPDATFNCAAFVVAAKEKYLVSKPYNPSSHLRPAMPSVLCELAPEFARVYKDDLALGQCA